MHKLKILFLSIIMCLAISCSAPHWAGAGYSSIVSKYNNNYTEQQFDSVCTSENLPINLGNWLTLPMRDYESKDNIYRYSYILNDSLMFIVTKDGDSYIVNKRILTK